MRWYSMNIDHDESFTSLFEQEDSFYEFRFSGEINRRQRWEMIN